MSVLTCSECYAMKELNKDVVLIDTCTQCSGSGSTAASSRRCRRSSAAPDHRSFLGNAMPPRRDDDRRRHHDDDDDERRYRDRGDRPRSRTSPLLDFFDWR